MSWRSCTGATAIIFSGIDQLYLGLAAENRKAPTEGFRRLLMIKLPLYNNNLLTLQTKL